MSKRIVILGAGESGVGAALLAVARGFNTFVSDMGSIAAKYKQVLEDNSIAFEEGRHTADLILNADEVIKSPGIPDKAPIVKALFEKGIPVISELEFAFRFTNAKMIAITGTNGKTTTTLLTYHLLKSAGLNVGLAGNVGKSFARQVLEKEFDYYVLEVSSFQLDGMYAFKSDISILLNITPDHLDRYDYKISNYVDSKFRIAQNMTKGDAFIYFAENPLLAEALPQKEIGAVTYGIHLDSIFGRGAWVEKENLNFCLDSKEGVRFSLSMDELPLQGKHNQINSMAAILAAMLVGIGSETIKKGLTTFKNAPHRLEPVASIKEVMFINDSKATNVDSVYYALESFKQPVVWIAGGTDKGNDYEMIRGLVEEKVKGLVCLGVDNEKLKRAFSGILPKIEETRNVNEAVKLAYAMASAGDAVVLTPACASFDLFKNYEDRGEQFKKAVIEFKNNIESR
jgi:UDP-N-acetylmuramoylalanine--D-glutamate ligase